MSPAAGAPEQPAPIRWDVVVPTVGRPSLLALLAALEDAPEHGLGRIVLVDDRPGAHGDPVPGDAGLPAALRMRIDVVHGGGRGPAAARNAGWACTSAGWVVFLDDDVLPPAGWAAALVADLRRAAPTVAGVQARLEVPLPAGRRPTDQERSDLALTDARWATADMAYRRPALEAAGGFDERFPRAYREDADLALRLLRAGWTLERGERVCVHPPRTAPWTASVRRQRGNADDPLMRALHGPDWRAAAGVPRGRRRVHVATVAAGAGAVALAAAGRPRAAAVPALLWVASTAEFAVSRIVPGPRTPGEIAAMVATSVAIPPAAVGHWVRGWVRVARATDRTPQETAPPAVGTTPPGVAAPPSAARPPVVTPSAPSPSAFSPSASSPSASSPAPVPRRGRPAAVLFDRDATLVVDVPYNGDPDAVVPMPGAREAVDRVRAAGIPVGVVSNQSGVARGILTTERVEAVNARVAELLGPFDVWRFCPHGPDDGCACRKPAPGMVLDAARELGVAPEDCAVVGDIGADVAAAAAAGARGILVPTPVTRAEEVADAPEVAPDLGAAVDLLLTPDRVPA